MVAGEIGGGGAARRGRPHLSPIAVLDTVLALLQRGGVWWLVPWQAVRTRGGGGAPPTTYEPPGPFP